MRDFYDVIGKRRSVRKFDDALTVSEEELAGIREFISELASLDAGIRVKLDVVRREQTTAKWGEYCVLMYSEQKPHYLTNAGYMLEQVDLYLAAHDMGACWYGLAKPEEKEIDGLAYVIMIAFGKSRPEEFRSNADEFTRQGIDEIWTGDFSGDVIEGVRLAPSACNTQPWRITSGDGRITVRRETGLESFLRGNMLEYFNAIDMGICLCCLEMGLEHEGRVFERTMMEDGQQGKIIDVAEYTIGK